MFVIKCPGQLYHYASNYSVAKAVAFDLAGPVGFFPSGGDPNATQIPIEVVRGVEIHSLQPTYPFGTVSELRFRYNYNGAGDISKHDCLYLSVDKVGMVFFPHQRLGAMIEINLGLQEVKTVRVSLKLGFGPEKETYGLPVAVSFVKLYSVSDVFCLTFEQAKQLKADLIQFKPQFDKAAKPFIAELPKYDLRHAQ